MGQVIATGIKKKATNLILNSDLLAEAKHFKINLSATMEKALAEEVRQMKERQWLQDNQSALKSCNKLIEKNGMFSDAYRTF